jgi:hypothetical protein
VIQGETFPSFCCLVRILARIRNISPIQTGFKYQNVISFIIGEYVLLKSVSGLVGVFCTNKNRVVKIACSNCEIVLRTTKHTMIYPDSGPFLEVIALRPTV